MGEFGACLRGEWLLDPSLSYLNHGTVGATPRRVLDAQFELMRAAERDPATFLLRQQANETGTPWAQPSRLRAALAEVAGFVGADADGLAFVDNITAGANIVLRSFPLGPGDEVLITSLGYGGIDRAAERAARTAGANVVRATMPPLGAPPHAFTEAIAGALTARTRIAVIDHLAASSALLLPLTEIAAACHAAGVAVLADGAHVPGGVHLDIESLGVDFYVANLHKWAWVPRSSGILWAAAPHRVSTTPVVTSWGLDQGWEAEFDMPGTRDASAHLSAPVALAMLAEYGFGRIVAHNHDLVWWAAQHLADALGTTFDTPESMIGQMATVRLPDRFGSTPADAKALQARLRAEHQIEVGVGSGVDPGRLTMRIAAQIYVDQAEFETLAQVVAAL